MVKLLATDGAAITSPGGISSADECVVSNVRFD
jgi:hypothetical protein